LAQAFRINFSAKRNQHACALASGTREKQIERKRKREEVSADWSRAYTIVTAAAAAAVNVDAVNADAGARPPQTGMENRRREGEDLGGKARETAHGGWKWVL